MKNSDKDRAKEAVINYLNAMSKKDWELVKKYIQKTWIETRNSKYVQQYIEQIHKTDGWDDIERYEVLSAKPKSETTCDVIVRFYPVNKEVEPYDQRHRVVCEKAPYSPSIWGVWGVNPASVHNSTL